MRVIQSFNTFGGERMTAGFKTKRAMIDYLAETYEHHIHYDYMMYTDTHGAELLNQVMDTKHITVISFPVISLDRIPYIGKFIVQSLQSMPYIHVDIDAKLLEMPDNHADVYCERLEGRAMGYEVSELKINTLGIAKIPCSALIGFTDMQFKDLYISEVYKLIELSSKIHGLNYKHCWAIEEVKLAEMILTYNKSVSATKNEHLHSLK
jgi:hypothetical protein